MEPFFLQLFHHFFSHFPRQAGSGSEYKQLAFLSFFSIIVYLKMHGYYCTKELSILFVLENWKLKSHLAHVEIILS